MNNDNITGMIFGNWKVTEYHCNKKYHQDEIMSSINYYKIYDCENLKFEWKNETTL